MSFVESESWIGWDKVKSSCPIKKWLADFFFVFFLTPTTHFFALEGSNVQVVKRWKRVGQKRSRLNHHLLLSIKANAHSLIFLAQTELHLFALGFPSLSSSSLVFLLQVLRKRIKMFAFNFEFAFSSYSLKLLMQEQFCCVSQPTRTDLWWQPSSTRTTNSRTADFLC